MSGPDYSRAGTARDRAPTVVNVAPITSGQITDATEEGIELLTGDTAAIAAAVAEALGLDDPASYTQWVELASDRTNNDATPNTIADVTGLSFAAVNGGSYWFRACIRFTAAAGTTGSRWSINGPTTSALTFKVTVPTSTTAESFSHETAYDAPAACTTDSPTSGIVEVEGFLTATADGTVVVRFASEVAGSAIVAKAGSLLQYRRVA